LRNSKKPSNKKRTEFELTDPQISYEKILSSSLQNLPLSPDQIENCILAFQTKDISPLYDGTLPVLQKLKRNNIRMGLIRQSRLPRNAFQLVLEKIELQDFFEVIVLSGEVGFRKPQREIFEHGLKMAKLESVPKNRILYVGNETNTDILGARTVGWKTVLIKNTESSSFGLADWEIDSLKELELIVYETDLNNSNSHGIV